MRRRSSNDVDLGIIGGIAALVAVGTIGVVAVAAATDDEEVEEVTAVCVAPSPAADGGYQVVDDRFCEGGSHHTYIYYYGGSTTGGYVRGGTITRPPNAEIVTRSGKVIQRGGLGGRGGTGS
jgi:hypothetical protein